MNSIYCLPVYVLLFSLLAGAHQGPASSDNRSFGASRLKLSGVCQTSDIGACIFDVIDSECIIRCQSSDMRLPDCWQVLSDLNYTSLTFETGNLLPFNTDVSLAEIKIEGSPRKEVAGLNQVSGQQITRFIKNRGVRQLKLIVPNRVDKDMFIDNQITFKDVDSAYFTNFQLRVMPKNSVNLNGVINFTMARIEVEFGVDRNSIRWSFGRSTCPTSPINLFLVEIVGLEKFNKHSIVIEKDCQGALELQVFVKGPNLVGLPEQVGDAIFFANGNSFLLHSDPIECCQTINNWLFQKGNLSERSFKLAEISCRDVGGTVQDLNDTRRRSICKNFRVTSGIPTYQIGIIVLGTFAILLLLLGAIFLCNRKRVGSVSKSVVHDNQLASTRSQNGISTIASSGFGKKRSLRAKSKGKIRQKSTSLKRSSLPASGQTIKTQAINPARSGTFETLG